MLPSFFFFSQNFFYLFQGESNIGKKECPLKFLFQNFLSLFRKGIEPRKESIAHKSHKS